MQIRLVFCSSDNKGIVAPHLPNELCFQYQSSSRELHPQSYTLRWIVRMAMAMCGLSIAKYIYVDFSSSIVRSVVVGSWALLVEYRLDQKNMRAGEGHCGWIRDERVGLSDARVGHPDRYQACRNKKQMMSISFSKGWGKDNLSYLSSLLTVERLLLVAWKCRSFFVRWQSNYPSVFHVKKEGVTKLNLLLLPLSLLSLLLFVFRPQSQRA